MRYDFQCESCGAVEEHVFSMAQKPDHLQCKCGGQASSLISANIEFFAMGNQLDFKLDNWNNRPIGWENGNTDAAAQERTYARIVKNTKAAALANDKQAIKGGLRMIARQPREHFRARTHQFGKDFYQDDVKKKLKADGLLFKD